MNDVSPLEAARIYIYSDEDIDEEVIDVAEPLVAKAYHDSPLNVPYATLDDILKNAIASEFLVFADDEDRDTLYNMVMKNI